MNLIIRNISFAFTEQDLDELFSRFGDVQRTHVARDVAGRSRGFAFCEMVDPRSGRDAIAELDGAEIAGRTISVCEARRRMYGALSRAQ
jgi:RNA recognition motif-containing protein